MNEPKTPPKTLSLKRPVEAGVVKQSFSHGRTKTVVVEMKKSRTLGPAKAPAAREVAPPPAPPRRPSNNWCAATPKSPVASMASPCVRSSSYLIGS